MGAQKRISDNEQRMRLASELAGLGYWEWNIKTNVIHWDAQMFRIYGVPPTPDGTVVYQDWRDAVLPEDLPGQEKALEETVRRQGHSRREFRIRRRNDGQVRTIQAMETVQLDNKGKVEWVMGTNQDITERLAAAETMRRDREQQATLRELLENTLTSGRLEDILDRCLAQLLNISWLSLQPKGAIFLKVEGKDCLQMVASRNLAPEVRTICDIVPFGRCICGQAAASKEIQFASHVDEHHENTYPGMVDHGHFSVPLISSGEVVGVLVLYLPPGIQQELSHEEFLSSVGGILASYLSRHAAGEKLAEYSEHLQSMVAKRTAELSNSEARSRAILRTMLDGVIHIDHRGTILAANDAACTMFGYAEEELVGENVNILMPEPHRSAHDGYLRSYVERHESKILGHMREVEGRRKDGTLFPLELATNEMVDDAGITFIGVLHDITEHKQVEAEREAARIAAQRLAEVKGNFLANMSHEIRTPLNAVLGLAKIGIRKNAGRQTSEDFRRILDSGQHLLGVINDILDFSKIESGKLAVESHPFRLDAVVSECVEMMAERAREKDLGLETSLATGLPEWVRGDPLRLKQILVNLLGNAVKFTQRGEVTLRVAREGKDTYFKAIDTGIGLTEEQQSRLFTPFEQADSSTTRRYGGTGLGLTISRQLAHLMGGEISVESRHGEGSAFTLRLPMEAAEPPSIAHAPEAREAFGPRLANLRVLAAEDVEVNRLILEELLVHEGGHIVFAENGQQALDLLEEMGVTAFDVVLMDVQMPVMDGLEATRRIRKIAPALPVIGLTAHALAEERERCLAAGMAERLTKPIEMEELVQAILHHSNGHDSMAWEAPARGEDSTPAVGSGAIPGTKAKSEEGIHALVDLPALHKRFEGRKDFIDKLLGKVVDSNKDTPQKLHAAIDRGDAQSIGLIAHSLKGLGGNIQATELRSLASRVEQHIRGRKDESPLPIQEIHALAEILGRVLKELEQYLHGVNTSSMGKTS